MQLRSMVLLALIAGMLGACKDSDDPTPYITTKGTAPRTHGLGVAGGGSGGGPIGPAKNPAPAPAGAPKTSAKAESGTTATPGK